MIYLSYYSVGFITAFSSVLMQADIAIFMIGISSVSIGITEFIVGYGLWKLHKWAGMLGLILAGFSFLLGIPYLMLNQFSGALTLGFAVVLLFLIYIGNISMVEIELYICNSVKISFALSIFIFRSFISCAATLSISSPIAPAVAAMFLACSSIWPR